MLLDSWRKPCSQVSGWGSGSKGWVMKGAVWVLQRNVWERNGPECQWLWEAEREGRKGHISTGQEDRDSLHTTAANAKMLTHNRRWSKENYVVDRSRRGKSIFFNEIWEMEYNMFGFPFGNGKWKFIISKHFKKHSKDINLYKIKRLRAHIKDLNSIKKYWDKTK